MDNCHHVFRENQQKWKNVLTKNCWFYTIDCAEVHPWTTCALLRVCRQSTDEQTLQRRTSSERSEDFIIADDFIRQDFIEVGRWACSRRKKPQRRAWRPRHAEIKPQLSCGCKSGEFVQLREAVNKSRHQHQLTSVIDIELYSNKNKKK